MLAVRTTPFSIPRFFWNHYISDVVEMTVAVSPESLRVQRVSVIDIRIRSGYPRLLHIIQRPDTCGTNDSREMH